MQSESRRPIPHTSHRASLMAPSGPSTMTDVGAEDCEEEKSSSRCIWFTRGDAGGEPDGGDGGGNGGADGSLSSHTMHSVHNGGSNGAR